MGSKIASEGGNNDKRWEFWTDSKAAIVQCEKKFLSTSDMMAPESDIILAFRHQMQKHGVNGHFHHVKGHQDEVKKFSELDKEAKYNVLCDEYATKATKQEQPSELPYSGSKAMLNIDGEWITRQYEKRVIDEATYPVMKTYIHEKYQWGDEEFIIIDWTAVEQARKGCKSKNGPR